MNNQLLTVTEENYLVQNMCTVFSINTNSVLCVVFIGKEHYILKFMPIKKID